MLLQITRPGTFAPVCHRLAPGPVSSLARQAADHLEALATVLGVSVLALSYTVSAAR